MKTLEHPFSYRFRFTGRIIHLALFVLTFYQLGHGQNLRAYEKAGDAAYDQRDYGTALVYYRTVLNKRDDESLLWKYAESARMYQAFQEAERAYTKLQKKNRQKKEGYPLLDFQLGMVYKSLGEYPRAITFFEKFLNDKPTAPAEYFPKAQEEIGSCLGAQKAIVAADKNLKIRHLGKEVNSPYSDFAPLIVGDTLYYSSLRFDKKTKFGKPKQKTTRLLMSVKEGRARELGRGFSTSDTTHLANAALTPDGRYMIFTQCKDQKDGSKHCELWLSVLDRLNRWQAPIRLPEPINMKGYTSTQPTIGYDSVAQGPTLWFVSDRPGGKGKLDIWRTPLDTVFFCTCMIPLPGKKITRLPKIKKLENIASINTPEDDITPFFHGPSQRLFFSTKGRAGFGNYDIYVSKKTADTYSEPLNMGYGVNTSYDDLYLALKPDGLNGYLSSNRTGSYYLDEKNKACCYDIFALTLPELRQPENPKQPKEEVQVPASQPDTMSTLVLKTPEIQKSGTVSPEPIPQIPSLQEFVGLPLYFDNDEPDKRTRKIATDKSYDESVLAYLDRQLEYSANFARGLQGVQADEAESMVDAFFENEVRRGYDRLGMLCDILQSRLQNGETIEVVIKGFTSPRAQSEYNLNLGKRRISSVRNQFERFNEGALQNFLRSGQLRVVEASFGETTARLGISDNLKDERNSIYHPEAARERRVEIVEIKNK